MTTFGEAAMQLPSRVCIKIFAKDYANLFITNLHQAATCRYPERGRLMDIQLYNRFY